MASNCSSRSAERPRTLVHVAAIAVAILSYLLLPLLHAGHHHFEHVFEQNAGAGLATSSSVGTDGSHGRGCHHHSCRDGRTIPTDSTKPFENPHDHSSCEVCQALYSARKNIDLPAAAVVPVAAGGWFEVIAAMPLEVSTAARPLPRSSRGPPLNA